MEKINLDKKSWIIVISGVAVIVLLIMMAGWMIYVSMQVQQQMATTVSSSQDSLDKFGYDLEETMLQEKSDEAEVDAMVAFNETPSTSSEIPTTLAPPTVPPTIIITTTQPPSTLPTTTLPTTLPTTSSTTTLVTTTTSTTLATTTTSTTTTTTSTTSTTTTTLLTTEKVLERYGSSGVLLADEKVDGQKYHVIRGRRIPRTVVRPQKESGTLEVATNQTIDLKAQVTRRNPDQPSLPTGHNAAQVSVEGAWKPLMEVLAPQGFEQGTPYLLFNNSKLDLLVKPKSDAAWQVVRQGSEWVVDTSLQDGGNGDSETPAPYAVQMLSVEEKRLSRALEIAEQLIQDGYYAYLFRSLEPIKNKHWYRLRVGFFPEAKAAKSMGEEIYHRYRNKRWFSERFWAVLPTTAEQNHWLLDASDWAAGRYHIQVHKPATFNAALEQALLLMEKSVPTLLKIAPDQNQGYWLEFGSFASGESARDYIDELSKQHSWFKQANPVSY